jgi:pyruvate,water dikinase
MEMRASIETRIMIELQETAALDRSQVGSKAAILASLLQAGYPVPPGWVLTTTARALAGDSDSLPLQLEAALESILAMVGEMPLAVRSSAISEDLADASFAGQYQTTLGVRGRAQLETAVRACWESVHSSHAESYRDGRSEEKGMAVLIQPMVEATAAGVVFTAQPVTGDRGQSLIEAVAGRGDPLVSGAATPEQWLVADDDAHRVSTGDQIIDARSALEIARLARRVEGHFGGPQDIEWALEGDALWLLQARPITSLAESPIEPIPLKIEAPAGFWEHDASHFPHASYPIDSFVHGLVAEGVSSWVSEFGYLFDGIEFRDIGGWTYQRLRPIGGREGPSLPGWLMWLVARTVPMVRRRVAVARNAVATDKPGRFIRRWYDDWLPELSTSIDGLVAVERASLTDEELLDHLDRVVALVGRGIEIHALVHGALAPILFELATTCQRALGWDLDLALRLVSGTSFKSTAPARRLHELGRMAAKRPGVLDVTGIEEEAIVEGLERTEPEFAAALSAYVDRYGHRALGDSAAKPTIAERPSLVLGMIRNQIATGYDPDAIERANARAREQATAQAREELAGDSAALREFERVLRRAIDAYPAREDNEFYTLSAPFALLRYVVLELGERLAGRDVIDDRDDVLFLHVDEARRALTSGVGLQDLVSRRRGERAWAVANPGPSFYGKPAGPPPQLWFLPKDSRLPMESMLWSLESMLAIGASKTGQSDRTMITGMPASAGSYTGPVRIIRDESEFGKLQAGDVLVCPITSPVWSVLFPTIGALVTDTGGTLSHPAIIAREYRIPAVVATGNATGLLEDGRLVTVDGSSGTISGPGGPHLANDRGSKEGDPNDAE